jgi:HEAT repeat protein
MTAAGIVMTLHAISFGGQDAGDTTLDKLRSGLARAGTKSIASARAFLKAEAKKTTGIAGEVRALDRRLKAAEFLEELAEIGFESTRGVIRVRLSGKAVAGRFISIVDGVLSLKTSTGKTIKLEIAELDARSIVKFSDAGASRRGKPLKAAAYYLMRGDPAAARRALGKLDSAEARKLREYIGETDSARLSDSGRSGEAAADIDKKAVLGLPPRCIAAKREFNKITSRKPGLFYDAVNAYPQGRSWGMLPDLLKATVNRSSLVRGFAFSELRKMRHPQVLERFRDLAKNHRSDSIRARAVGSLSHQVGAPIIPKLLDLLAKDKSAEVRAAAASGLGDWRTPEIVAALLRAMNGVPEVRGAAAISLKELGVVDAVPVLVKALERSISKSMADISAKSVERKFRRACVTALGSLGDDQVLPALTEALKAERSLSLGRTTPGSWDILRALQAIGSKKAMSIIHGLADDDSEFLRGLVAMILGNIGDPVSTPVLEKMLKDPSAEVRRHAAGAIKNTSRPKRRARRTPPLRLTEEQHALGMRVLIKKLRSSGGAYDRAAAARSLGTRKDPSAIPPLLKAMNDHDFVKAAAAKALAKLNVAEAGPLIMKCLTSDNVDLRTASAYALEEFGRRTSIPALREALRKEDPTLASCKSARAIIRVLGCLGAHVALGEIQRFRKSPDRQVRFSVGWALANIGTAEVVPALGDALSDTNSSIREDARRFLKEIRTGEALKALRDAKK